MDLLLIHAARKYLYYFYNRTIRIQTFSNIGLTCSARSVLENCTNRTARSIDHFFFVKKR